MTNYKSPYKAVGLTAVNAVSGKATKKQKAKQMRRNAVELPTNKQIAKAKLTPFSDYAADFVDGPTTYGKKKERRKNP